MTLFQSVYRSSILRTRTEKKHKGAILYAFLYIVGNRKHSKGSLSEAKAIYMERKQPSHFLVLVTL